MTLPADPRSPGQARRFVAGALEDAGLDYLEDAVLLLVSELVTNALLHARTAISVACTITRAELLVEVTDGSGVLPQRRHYATTATTGRGLALVEATAQDWGVERRDDGKVVWFTLPTQPGAVRGDRTEATVEFGLDAVEAL